MSRTGRELVRRKVAVLFVMAPYFNERNDYQRAYNFITSPKAAVELVNHWPTKIKFGEGNLGHRHFIGSRLSETPVDNPARIAFEAYFAAEKLRSDKIENFLAPSLRRLQDIPGGNSNNGQAACGLKSAPSGWCCRGFPVDA